MAMLVEQQTSNLGVQGFIPVGNVLSLWRFTSMIGMDSCFMSYSKIF